MHVHSDRVHVDDLKLYNAFRSFIDSLSIDEFSSDEPIVINQYERNARQLNFLKIVGDQRVTFTLYKLQFLRCNMIR